MVWVNIGISLVAGVIAAFLAYFSGTELLRPSRKARIADWARVRGAQLGGGLTVFFVFAALGDMFIGVILFPVGWALPGVLIAGMRRRDRMRIFRQIKQLIGATASLAGADPSVDAVLTRAAETMRPPLAQDVRELLSQRRLFLGRPDVAFAVQFGKLARKHGHDELAWFGEVLEQGARAGGDWIQSLYDLSDYVAENEKLESERVRALSALVLDGWVMAGFVALELVGFLLWPLGRMTLTTTSFGIGGAAMAAVVLDVLVVYVSNLGRSGDIWTSAVTKSGSNPPAAEAGLVSLSLKGGGG